MITIEYLIQYGIAGAALYMMYRLLTNDLKSIKLTLVEIKEILIKKL